MLARQLSALCVLVLLGVVGACSSSPPEEAPGPRDLRIGLLLPLSGPDQVVGREALRGAQLAVDLINSAESGIALPLAAGTGLPGLRGGRVVLVTGDTRGEPEVGTTEGARLTTREGVSAVVVAGDAATTRAVGQRVERQRVPVVSAGSSADYLTELGFDWFFRVTTTDRIQAEAALSLAASAGGGPVERIAVVRAEGDPTGTEVATTLTELATESGIALSEHGEVPDPSRPAQELRRVAADDPQVVFVAAADPADARSLLPRVRELGSRPAAVVAVGSGFDDATLTELGDEAEGVLRVNDYSQELAQRHPTAGPVAARYRELHSATMTDAAAEAFSAVLAVAQAADAAGSPDPIGLRTALIGLDVPGSDTIMPWDVLRFDAFRQNTGASAVVEQMVAGHPRVVHPRELARQQPVWPLAATDR